MNRAIALLAEAGGRQRAAPKQLREIGNHPKDGKPITLHQGRFGPYIRHGRDNASLRKAHDPEKLGLEEAVALLAERAAKGKSKSGGKAKAAAKTGNGAAAKAAKPAAKPKKPAGKTAARRPAAGKGRAAGRAASD
jgi:DNA topoisomerase-1